MRPRGRQPFVRLFGIGVWLQLMLVLALLWFAAGAVHAAPSTPVALPCAEVVRQPITGVLRVARQCATLTSPDASPEAIAEAFLSRYHQTLGFAADLSDLRLVSVKYGLNSSHILYQQTYAGLPVYRAYVSVHLGRDGRVQVVQNGYLPGLTADLTSATVDADKAVTLAREAIGFVRPRGESPAPEQMILPLEGNRGTLVWKVMLLASEPQGDWEVLVDATSGEVIKRYNRLVLAKGQVFTPNPAQQGGTAVSETDPVPAPAVVDLQGLDGSGWLRGEHVDVTQPVGYRPAAAYDLAGNFLYAPDDPRFAEVMVYYHIDTTQRYIESLGYSNANTPPNGIRDRVTYASPHWFEQDQSFYSSSDDALHFGDGGIPDAQDADIIVHEYAHALQHDQLACWGGGEMDAVGEGFGDYLAASRFADIGDDPACIAEWDSRSYASGPPYCLRRVDNDRRYPQDLTGDPHLDGEIWSRVLWDLRAVLGQRVADTLALESNFYLPCGATLVDAGQALLDADANLYDGTHRVAIERALVRRGLLDLPAPTLLTPAAGEHIMPDQLVAVRWNGAFDLISRYDLQVSLNADRVETRVDTFDSRRLPAGYQSFGNQPWHVQDGVAQAGPIAHQESSSLLLEVDLARPGELRFRYRVSSEEGWDIFEVFVDGQPIVRASGQVGWTWASQPLAVGPHTLLWRYRKDSTLSAGEDSAWIDDVTISNVSAATWQPIEVVGGDPASGHVLWRVPTRSSSAVKLRLRGRLGDVTSPWTMSPGYLLLGEPAAVRLDDFEAEPVPVGRVPLLPWGLLGLLGATGLGVALECWLEKHR